MCRESCGQLTTFWRIAGSISTGKCWILAGSWDMRFTTSIELATRNCWRSCGACRIRFGCGCRESARRLRRAQFARRTEGETPSGQPARLVLRVCDFFNVVENRQTLSEVEGCRRYQDQVAEAAAVLADSVVEPGVEIESRDGPGVVMGEAGIPLMARVKMWTVSGGSSRTLSSEFAASFMKLAAVRMKILRGASLGR